MAAQDQNQKPQIQGLDALVNTEKLKNQNLSALVKVLQDVFPRTFGRFTLPAGVSQPILQKAVTSNSRVFCFPVTASAAALNIYHQVGLDVPGQSFQISTTGGAAVGTEVFDYFIINPV